MRFGSASISSKDCADDESTTHAAGKSCSCGEHEPCCHPQAEGSRFCSVEADARFFAYAQNDTRGIPCPPEHSLDSAILGESCSFRDSSATTLGVGRLSAAHQIGRDHRYDRFGYRRRESILQQGTGSVSYTHLRAHETPEHLVCR